MPSTAQSKPSTNHQIKAITKRLNALDRRLRALERSNRTLVDQNDRLDDQNAALLVRVRGLENADAGIKNTLMCLHAVPVTRFTWGLPNPRDPSNVFQIDTGLGTEHDWVMTADEYCLNFNVLGFSHRMMVPVEPPTFFPENH